MRRSLRMLAVVAVAMATSGLSAGGDLTLTARQSGGGLDMTYDWTVQLNGTELKVERTGRKPKVRRVRPKDIEALRQALEEGAFASLQSQYGCAACLDNPVCTLKVPSGSQANAVAVYAYFPSPDRAKSGETAEVQRFMRIWRVVKRVAGLSGMKDVCP